MGEVHLEAESNDPGNQYTEMATFSGLGETSKTLHPACLARYATPVLASRTVSYDGRTVAQTQTFTYTTVWPSDSNWQSIQGWSTKTTTVATTDNVLGKSFQTVYNDAPGFQPPGTPPFVVGGGASETPVESSTQYYDWNGGSPLRTVTKSWFDFFDLSEQDSTLESGQTAKTTYTYTGGSCVNAGCIASTTFPVRLTTKNEYGYDGSLLRSTATNYQTFGLSPYLTAVPPEPSSVVISDLSGPAAETDYVYDQGTLATPSVMQHDSNYGSGFTSRGNPTTKTQKCLAGTGCTADSTTKFAYDIAGQAVSMTDPCGNGACSDIPGSPSHTTNYYYADSGTNAPGNSDAYLTQIVQPVTNGVSHTENFTYNYTFGDLSTSVDQNGTTTTYTYNDPLDRLTRPSIPTSEKLRSPTTMPGHRRRLRPRNG